MLEKRQIPHQVIPSLINARLLREQTPIAESHFREGDSKDLPEQLRKNLLTIAGEVGDKAKAMAKEKQAIIDRLKGLPLKEQLSELGVEYFDIKTTQEQLDKAGKLIGKKLEFSKAEMERCEGLLTESLSEQELSQVIDIIDRVGKENVYFTQIPATWDVDGKTEPYSKRKFREIMLQVSEKDSNIQKMWQGSYVTEDTKDFISNGDLRIFTLECLEGSLNEEWDSTQLDLIEKLTGDRKPNEENAGAWIVGMIENIKTGRKPLRTTFMRVNTLGTDRAPLKLSSDEVYFYLSGSYRFAHPGSGAGVSLGFPKR